MSSPLKPASILQLQKGKLYSDQRDRVELEPKPAKELRPRCPQRFSKEERHEWKYFAAILKNYSLFTIANAPHLELLAIGMAQYKECSAKVSQTGIIVKGPQGQPMYNPYWNAVNKLEDKICRCLDTLGFGSLGLAKLGSLMLRHKKKESEMDDLLSR